MPPARRPTASRRCEWRSRSSLARSASSAALLPEMSRSVQRSRAVRFWASRSRLAVSTTAKGGRPRRLSLTSSSPMGSPAQTRGSRSWKDSRSSISI
jgi:hypothetical protein